MTRAEKLNFVIEKCEQKLGEPFDDEIKDFLYTAYIDLGMTFRQINKYLLQEERES